MRDATHTITEEQRTNLISIHASHAGRDHCKNWKRNTMKLFQSTRPMRDATSYSKRSCSSRYNFNPRVPCGTRLNVEYQPGDVFNISIHASHAGRDSDIHKYLFCLKRFLVLSQHNFIDFLYYYILQLAKLCFSV